MLIIVYRGGSRLKVDPQLNTILDLPSKSILYLSPHYVGLHPTKSHDYLTFWRHLWLELFEKIDINERKINAFNWYNLIIITVPTNPNLI